MFLVDEIKNLTGEQKREYYEGARKNYFDSLLPYVNLISLILFLILLYFFIQSRTEVQHLTMLLEEATGHL